MKAKNKSLTNLFYSYIFDASKGVNDKQADIFFHNITKRKRRKDLEQRLYSTRI